MVDQSVRTKDVSGARYTLTLDADPSTHNQIIQATGLENRWFTSCDALPQEEELDPVAVFLDAKLSLTGPQNGQLIPKFKDAWPLTPVILMTPGGHDADALTEAMALGADDFIAKPFEPVELKSRLDVRLGALQRRAAKETMRVGDLTIDTMQRCVASTKGQKFLSPTEIRLITELAKAGGAVVPRELLKKRCWPSTKVSDNALNRKLYEVRRRLEPLSERVTIRTIYGVGFVLEEKR